MGMGWNYEDKAIVSSFLGTKAFDYLIPRSTSAKCSLMEEMVEEEEAILLLDDFAPTTVAMCKAKVGFGLMHEANFIQQIVEVIGNKISRTTTLDVGPYEIGIHSRATEINTWLQDGATGIRGICGMGGIGKSTIAKYVYNENFTKFDGSSFLDSIREMCKQPNGLVKLQRQLLTDVLRRKHKRISNVHEGISKIKNALGCKRVLLVFDDVDNIDQFYAVTGTQIRLCRGSKIIITTRNNNLLNPEEVYRVAKLGTLESMKLFNLHAFGTKYPLESCITQTERVIKLCEGLPLALKVLGSSLSRKRKDKWDNYINKLEAVPHKTILETLEISYESLEDDYDKRLFLHIACFFVGEEKDVIVKVLEKCGLYAAVGIENLIDLCLLTIDSSNKLRMDRSIRDMGREIVHRESRDEPGKRSRLWLHEDSFNVLKTKTGTEKIEGLTLDMLMLEQENEELGQSIRSTCGFELSIDAFQKMENLRLLKLNHVHLSGSYESFPKNLRWLCWHGFPLKSVPIDLSLEKLIVLDMSYSKLKQVWKGFKLLGSLKILDLSYSKELIGTPNFSGSRYLERLILKGCVSLVEISESIEYLGDLVLLDLKDCKSLKKLPRNIHMLRSVETLIISGCSNLAEFPVNLRNMLSLQVLQADGIAVNALSTTASQDRLGHAISQPLVSRPRICPQTFLHSLPRTVVNLSLVCCGLSEDSFPSAFGNQPLLKELDLSNNFFGTLPDSIGSLRNLKSLTIRSCSFLHSILGLPGSLECMDMGYSYSVKKVSFQSSQTRIARVQSDYCQVLDEIEGFFKIEPIEEVDGKIIRSMGIDIKSIKNIEVPLLELGNSWIRPIQGLHEFGIFSTFIPGEMVPSCFSDKSKGSSISFSVTSLPNLRIRCLNVFSVYYYSRRNFPDTRLLTKIYNRTKGLTWIYCPLCVGFPYEANGMTWLSQWNFGNDQLEGGDEITVSIHTGFEVKECGINVVYEEQVENDEEDTDNHDNRYFFANEVIGGDLSNFQLSSGAYFLSRRIIHRPEICHVNAILEAFKDVADIKVLSNTLNPTFPVVFVIVGLIAGRSKEAEGALYCNAPLMLIGLLRPQGPEGVRTNPLDFNLLCFCGQIQSNPN
ncbi:hypothetical protein LguiA_008403 [Lonicera macranthoides]